MLYFAYGMNTNPGEMSRRCPGAVSMGHARLLDHSFRFSQHADVEPCEDSFVDGVLWDINQDHLQVLDLLEGYPHYYDLEPIMCWCIACNRVAKTRRPLRATIP
jgi:hypothetical protein